MNARRKLEVQVLELQTERSCARKNVRRGGVKPVRKIHEGWVGPLVLNVLLLGWGSEEGLGFPFPAEGGEAAPRQISSRKGKSPVLVYMV